MHSTDSPFDFDEPRLTRGLLLAVIALLCLACRSHGGELPKRERIAFSIREAAAPATTSTAPRFAAQPPTSRPAISFSISNAPPEEITAGPSSPAKDDLPVISVYVPTFRCPHCDVLRDEVKSCPRFRFVPIFDLAEERTGYPVLEWNDSAGGRRYQQGWRGLKHFEAVFEATEKQVQQRAKAGVPARVPLAQPVPHLRLKAELQRSAVCPHCGPSCTCGPDCDCAVGMALAQPVAHSDLAARVTSLVESNLAQPPVFGGKDAKKNSSAGRNPNGSG